jgi:hypothetical protein
MLKPQAFFALGRIDATAQRADVKAGRLQRFEKRHVVKLGVV